MTVDKKEALAVLERKLAEYRKLSYADLAGVNLVDANLYGATLTSADFSEAVVTGANFTLTASRGFTAEQLYATASYQNGKLTGIGLNGNGQD